MANTDVRDGHVIELRGITPGLVGLREPEPGAPLFQVGITPMLPCACSVPDCPGIPMVSPAGAITFSLPIAKARAFLDALAGAIKSAEDAEASGTTPFALRESLRGEPS